MASRRIIGLEKKFKKMAFDIDFSNLEIYKNEDYDYYKGLLLKLDEIYEKVNQVREAPLEPAKKFRFKITTNFDKRFYCAAKIADNAKILYYEPILDSYFVTYTGDQLDEIENSYEVLCTVFNSGRADMIAANQYLMEKSPFFRLNAELHLMGYYPSGEQIPWFDKWPSYPIIIQLRNMKKNIINGLYSQMRTSGRVPTKWKSEYKLYYYVKLYCPEAEYQFHCDWLGLQSFDIYLPKQRVAIEYQGEQHYKDNSFFSSTDTKERDERKRAISIEHNVKIYYYPYERELTRETILCFLGENDIEVISIDLHGREIITDCPGLYIAPRINSTKFESTENDSMC